MDQYAPLIMQTSGYLTAALAVWILLRCAISMLQEKYEPEIWAYLEMPDGSSKPINNWECILGRSRASDVVLHDRSVGRSHAALQRSARGRWLVYDLHSRGGGTFVNGQPVAKSARLRDGDTLQLGDVELQFIALSSAQRKSLQRHRREPGRRVRPAVTMMLLTLFQLLLTAQHAITAPDGDAPSVALAFGVVIALEWFCLLAVRAFALKGFEPETLAFFLSSVGLSVSASSAPGEMLKAALLLVLGVAVFALLGWWLRDLRRVKLLRWPMAFAAGAFLCVNLALSEEIFGAKNWLSIGGVMLQPSELVKVAYVYVGAATIDRLFRRRNLILFIGFSAFIVGALALMGDFGTALVFFTCFLVISFMRSGSFATVLLAVSGAGLAGMLVLTVKPYVARRFASRGHVWEDPLGSGYQQVRAMSATASGGLFGQGAGNGWLREVPAADTDLVFGMVSEELGLIVAFSCMAAVILLALFAVRNAEDGRSAYYVIASCASVTIMLSQLALNVFGSLDILPFTGVTFPFVSKGGSSLISCCALLAYITASDTRQNSSFALGHRFSRRDDEESLAEEEHDDEADDEEDEE
ncbi:MAG: FtsW/RodA/SpoVE family cell cycle protein [Oscillospiraceae bacterium]|nr:FtsW/RodA/SpoVE family cell cycle protein [Oscillospiraceae bacterium]